MNNNSKRNSNAFDTAAHEASYPMVNQQHQQQQQLQQQQQDEVNMHENKKEGDHKRKRQQEVSEGNSERGGHSPSQHDEKRVLKTKEEVDHNLKSGYDSEMKLNIDDDDVNMVIPDEQIGAVSSSSSSSSAGRVEFKVREEAPNLEAYLCPGGTAKFIPRSEWCRIPLLAKQRLRRSSNGNNKSDEIGLAALGNGFLTDNFDLSNALPANNSAGEVSANFSSVLASAIDHEQSSQIMPQPQPPPQFEGAQHQDQSHPQGRDEAIAAAASQRQIRSPEFVHLNSLNAALGAADQSRPQVLAPHNATELMIFERPSGPPAAGVIHSHQVGGHHHHHHHSDRRTTSPEPWIDQDPDDENDFTGILGTSIFGGGKFFMDEEYNTALHIAVRDGATEAALEIIRFGAPLDFPNIKGVTPMAVASQRGATEVVRALLERGANPHLVSQTGSTPLIQASHFGHRDIVQLLLQHGALVEQANYKSTTALMRAAQEGHEAIVALLLRHRADANRKNHEKMSSLMLASQRGHSKIVKMLIQAGAEIDVKTAQDSTSLMLACKRGNYEVAKILVAAGTELMLRDHKGRTARDTAMRKGYSELCNLLAPPVQIKLMKTDARINRNYFLVKMWILLQHERATVIIDHENQAGVTIHQISQDVEGFARRRIGKWKQALILTMALPAPLMELIARLMPLPNLWDRRIEALTSRCHIDPDSTMSCVFDLIDEVLAEGGFAKACDLARVSSPGDFNDWAEWEAWGRKCDSTAGKNAISFDSSSSSGSSEGEDTDDAVDNNCSNMGNRRAARLPPHSSTLELRRKACFLRLLAHESPSLARILSQRPYNMPGTLIKRLKRASDFQTIVRRMSMGVHFEIGVAVEMVMLASQVIMWHQSNFGYPNE